MTLDGRMFYFTSAAIIEQHLEVLVKEMRGEREKRKEQSSEG
jgi:hypothetical protein